MTFIKVLFDIIVWMWNDINCHGQDCERTTLMSDMYANNINKYSNPLTL